MGMRSSILLRRSHAGTGYGLSSGHCGALPLGAYYLAYLKVHDLDIKAAETVRSQLEVLESAMRGGLHRPAAGNLRWLNPVSSRRLLCPGLERGENCFVSMKNWNGCRAGTVKKRGRNAWNLRGIYHKTSEQMSYPLNERELIINLKTGYDVEKGFIHYGDPFEAGILGGKGNLDRKNGRKFSIKRGFVSRYGGPPHWFPPISVVNIFLSCIPQIRSGTILRMVF